VPQGEPCYVLVWEGLIGAFYEVDASQRVSKVGDVMTEPGGKYAFAYAIANPRHPERMGLFDPAAAGKLMALAGFSSRDPHSPDEEKLTVQLLEQSSIVTSAKKDFAWSPLFDRGVESEAFKEFAGKFSDRLFDTDIVIGTWAKTGTTWLQQILGQLLFDAARDMPLFERSPWMAAAISW
jgi:hypothetical protein